MNNLYLHSKENKFNFNKRKINNSLLKVKYSETLNNNKINRSEKNKIFHKARSLYEHPSLSTTNIFDKKTQKNRISFFPINSNTNNQIKNIINNDKNPKINITFIYNNIIQKRQNKTNTNNIVNSQILNRDLTPSYINSNIIEKKDNYGNNLDNMIGNYNNKIEDKVCNKNIKKIDIEEAEREKLKDLYLEKVKESNKINNKVEKYEK